MYIDGIVWLDEVIDKIESKHHVYKEEVEEVFDNRPKYRRGKKENMKAKICIMLMAEATAAVICL